MPCICTNVSRSLSTVAEFHVV